MGKLHFSETLVTTIPHGVTSQENWVFISIAVRASNIVLYFIVPWEECIRGVLIYSCVEGDCGPLIEATLHPLMTMNE